MPEILNQGSEIFELFILARDAALKTGRKEDATKAGRLYAAFMDTFLPQEQRWPRDPSTYRILAPSEIGVSNE